MVLSQLKQFSSKQLDVSLLLGAFVTAVTTTMPQFPTLSPTWWIMLVINLAFLPLGWLALHYGAPVIGEKSGTFVAFMIIIAVPLAMLTLTLWRIIIHIISQRLPWVYLTTDAQSEPTSTATYSVATLFSPRHGAYALHPITQSLLYYEYTF